MRVGDETGVDMGMGATRGLNNVMENGFWALKRVLANIGEIQGCSALTRRPYRSADTPTTSIESAEVTIIMELKQARLFWLCNFKQYLIYFAAPYREYGIGHAEGNM